MQLLGAFRPEPPQPHRRRQHHHAADQAATAAAAAAATSSAHQGSQPHTAAAPPLPDCYSHTFAEQSRWLCRQPVNVLVDCKSQDRLTIDQPAGQGSQTVCAIELPPHGQPWSLFLSFRLPKIPAIAWNHGLGQTETKLLRFSVTFELVKVRLLE